MAVYQLCSLLTPRVLFLNSSEELNFLIVSYTAKICGFLFLFSVLCIVSSAGTAPTTQAFCETISPGSGGHQRAVRCCYFPLRHLLLYHLQPTAVSPRPAAVLPPFSGLPLYSQETLSVPLALFTWCLLRTHHWDGLLDMGRSEQKWPLWTVQAGKHAQRWAATCFINIFINHKSSVSTPCSWLDPGQIHIFLDT